MKSIFYESFNELVQDNFQIFTRTLLIYVEAPNDGNMEFGRNPLNIFVNNHSINIATEMDSDGIEFQIMLRISGVPSIVNSSLRKYEILREAKVHPNVNFSKASV